MDVPDLIVVTTSELVLSVDNVMVWALIMARLDVPKRLHRPVLAAGIGIAVALRIAAILIGAAALERAAWPGYLLGGVLLLTACRLWRSDGSDEVATARWAARLGSPAVAAVVALGLTDVMFAVDSVPAAFAITTDAAVIITANTVALAALWSLYGVVSVLMERLVYLTQGLVAVLGWLGATMLLRDVVTVPHPVSLGVIVGTLAAATAASLMTSRAGEADRSHTPAPTPFRAGVGAGRIASPSSLNRPITLAARHLPDGAELCRFRLPENPAA